MQWYFRTIFGVVPILLDRQHSRVYHQFIKMSCERTIEGMKEDLHRGGWTMIHFDLWQSPSGALFRGPHLAWHNSSEAFRSRSHYRRGQVSRCRSLRSQSRHPRPCMDCG